MSKKTKVRDKFKIQFNSTIFSWTSCSPSYSSLEAAINNLKILETCSEEKNPAQFRIIKTTTKKTTKREVI